MPAGVTASNIRNNRKRQNQQQGVGFAGVHEGKSLNEIHSINGSEEFLGGRRRVGNTTVLFSLFGMFRCLMYCCLHVKYHNKFITLIHI